MTGSLPPDPTVRAPGYWIATSTTPCWRCGKQTCVLSFRVPVGHQTLEEVDEAAAGFGPDDQYTEEDFQRWQNSPDAFEWVHNDFATFVSNVDDLPDDIVTRVRSLSKNFRHDYSATAGEAYWMNHCDHCGMRQGDFHLHSEPGGAFFPVDEDAATSIALYPVAQPFACTGSTSYTDPDYTEFMQVIHSPEPLP